MEAEVIEKTTVPNPLGIAFNHPNTVQAIPMEAGVNFGADSRGNGGRSTFGEFLKPALSNLFLLGCLLGLFLLYCFSCIIHAVTFPARRKSS